MNQSDYEYIVHEADGTRYEIMVKFVDKQGSDYDQQYVVTLVNFGECHFDSELDSIGSIILNKSRLLGGIDARNIHNAIADRFQGVRRVEFDMLTRTMIPA